MQFNSARSPQTFLNRSCPATSYTGMKNTLLATAPTAWWCAPTFALEPGKWFSYVQSAMVLPSLNFTALANPKPKQHNRTEPVEKKAAAHVG